jgi:hypothetical protein
VSRSQFVATSLTVNGGRNPLVNVKPYNGFVFLCHGSFSGLLTPENYNERPLNINDYPKVSFSGYDWFSISSKIYSWLWESSCQAKHKFFLWLLLHDRLNTRNLLRIKKCQLQSYLCATIQCKDEETLVHLFCSCTFAIKCWDFICPQRHEI